jgi:hypothetical protein
MNKVDEVTILVNVLGAILELENLKPHVGDEQFAAAEKIRRCLGKIAEIVGNAS